MVSSSMPDQGARMLSLSLKAEYMLSVSLARRLRAASFSASVLCSAARARAVSLLALARAATAFLRWRSASAALAVAFSSAFSASAALALALSSAFWAFSRSAAACPRASLACCSPRRAACSEVQLHRFRLTAQVTAAADRVGEHVMGQLDALHVEALLRLEKAPPDQLVEGGHRSAALGEPPPRLLERHVLSEARLGEQLLLDERADLGG